jgi:hypothetical protein
MRRRASGRLRPDHAGDDSQNVVSEDTVPDGHEADVGHKFTRRAEATQVTQVELLGRPIVKAWNAIGSDAFARKAKPSGSPDRIAIPVAAGLRAVSLAEASGPGARGHYGARRGWREEPGRGLRSPPESRVVHVTLALPSPRALRAGPSISSDAFPAPGAGGPCPEER